MRLEDQVVIKFCPQRAQFLDFAARNSEFPRSRGARPFSANGLALLFGCKGALRAAVVRAW
jgi:hypothetical protein